MIKIPIAILLVLSAFNTYADDVAAGRAKADVACALCHGVSGLSSLPNAPHLAGQPAIYVVEQLRNYRSGKRQNEVMNVIAKNLSDAEISHLGAWFSAIKVSVETP
jgi:cytochrome c553